MQTRKNRDINKRLETICETIKNIPNIGLNYIEYISAFIYAISQDTEKYENLINENAPTKYILNELEAELEKIRKKENSQKLFINIQLLGAIDQEYYDTIKKIIIELHDIIKNEDKATLSKGFENLLNQSAEKDELKLRDGEYYTPRTLIDIMVNLLELKDNMSIYNPETGIGDFIVEAAKKAKIYAFGEETNIRNYNICMTNLWLHNVYNKRIQEDIGENFRFADVALGNPPFVRGDRKDIESNRALQDLYYKYNIPKTACNYTKFLVKMIESINADGRMAIILPHGFLFKKTNAEYYVRKQIVEKNYIEAIIGLPEKLFYKTKIPVVILIINKSKKGKKFLFIDASREYTKKRRNNIMEEEALDKIIKTYYNKEEIQNYSHLASLEEIEKNDYDLNIKKYVSFSYQREGINQEALQENIFRLEKEREEIQKEIEKIVKNHGY